MNTQQETITTCPKCGVDNMQLQINHDGTKLERKCRRCGWFDSISALDQKQNGKQEKK